MEFYLAFIAFISFSITNPCPLIKELLKYYSFFNHHQDLGNQSHFNKRQGSRSHPDAAAASFFTNVFDILNIISLSIKTLITDYFL